MSIQQEILDYIKTQRVGVLAVEMLDGSPHAATVHFAYTENPLKFFFETDRNYLKAKPLLKRDTTRASFVIGFDESKEKSIPARTIFISYSSRNGGGSRIGQERMERGL